MSVVEDLPEIKKRPGTTGSFKGYLYEIKLFMLVFYRAKLFKGMSFNMATNVDGIGALDDLVFVENTNPRRGFFLQAKCGTKITQAELFKPKGNFNLAKYFSSFRQIKDKYKNMEITCVLYCGGGEELDGDKKINEMNLTTARSSNRSGNLDDLISTRKGKKFQLNKSHFVDKLAEDDKHLAGEFLDRLWFYVDQPKEDALEKKLKKELAEQYLGSSNSFLHREYVPNYVFHYLYSKVQNWCMYPTTEHDPNNNGWLTDRCNYLEEAKESLSRVPTLTILNWLFRQKDQDSNLLKFSDDAMKVLKLDSFSDGALNIVTDHSALTSLKLLQAFREESNCLFVDWHEVVRQRWQNDVKNDLQGVNLFTVIVVNVPLEYELDCFKVKRCILVSKTRIRNVTNSIADELNGLTDLTPDTQETFLKSKEINFQDETVPLEHLISTDALRQAIDSKTLSILLTEEKIKLGKTPATFIYESIKDYYIERALLRQAIVKGLDRSKFFVAKSSEISEGELSKNTDIVTISTSDDVFQALVEKFNDRNIHWLKDLGGKLHWQKTHGKLNKIRDISSTTLKIQQEDIELEPIVLIAAEPGMGKSTLFCSLAKAIKSSKPSYWVANICLHRLSKDFSQWKETLSTKRTKQMVQRFLFDNLRFHQNENKSVGPALLEKQLFDHMFNEKKIVIFLDGYDAISPNYEDQALLLVNALKGHCTESLWISTRPNLQCKLEDQLGALAMKLKPFKIGDQKQFLQKFWEKNIETALNANSLDEFCDEFLIQFSHIIDDAMAGFVGIPLHLRMVAEVFANQCKKFCESTSGDSLAELKTEMKEMNLIDLYEKFFKFKFKVIALQEKERMDVASIAMKEIVDERETKLIKDHQIMAAFALLNKEVCRQLLTSKEFSCGKKLLEKVAESNEKTGIVYRIENNKPIFVHQTFAEFFLVGCFWTKAKESELNEPELYGMMQEFVLNGRVQICRFLQQKAAKEITKTESLLRICRAIVLFINNVDHHNIAWHLMLGIVNSYTSLTGTDSSDLSLGLEDLSQYNTEFLFCAAVKMNYLHLVEHLEERIEVWDVNKIYTYGNASAYFAPALRIATVEGHTKMVEHFIKAGANVNGKTEFGDTELHLAAERGYADIIKQLIEAGANVNATDNCRRTALMISSQKGHTDAVKYLLPKTTTNINAVDSYGNTTLHLASESGYTDIIKLLVAARANVDATDKYGRTALMISFQEGHTDAVEYLLPKTTTGINAVNSDEDTMLHLASERGATDIIKLLVAAGANVDATDKYGRTALMISSQKGDTDAVEYLLPKTTTSINAVNSNGDTMLHVASVRGDMDIIKQLIEAGANVDATNKYGRTALMISSQKGHTDAVEYLLPKTTTNNLAVDSAGNTTLHLASESGDTDIIKLLVAEGVNVDATNKYGKSALMISSEEGHMDAVKYLLSKTTTGINDVNSDGYTTLHLASESGDTDIIKLLVAAGANVDDTDKYGRTALIISYQRGHTDAVKYLLPKSTTSINAVNSNGDTMLHLASMRGDMDIIKLLVEAGVNVDAIDKYGRTALMISLQRHHSAAVEYLLPKTTTSINAVNSDGDTMLHLASLYGHTGIIKLLVAAGANVDATDKYGRTALMISSQKGHTDAVEYLLSNTATSINAVNSDGDTMLHLASLYGHTGIIKLLVEAGANVDARDKDGRTALMIAFLRSNSAAVEYLQTKRTSELKREHN